MINYVDARYLILIDIETINPGDIIECYIDCKKVDTDIDGGENLVLLNFRKEDILLSLGAYEMLYHYEDDKSFAFDIEYTDNGLKAYFIDTQFVERFRFAISWMNINKGYNRISTWYASDPAICDE